MNELSVIQHMATDELEEFLRIYAKTNPDKTSVQHHFTEGLYTRQIFMPAGQLIVSKIHNTQHPFVVSKGAATVWTVGREDYQLIEAPYMGITEPGTRRILFIHQDMIWTTFHPDPDNCRDVEQIEERIIIKRTDILLQENN